MSARSLASASRGRPCWCATAPSTPRPGPAAISCSTSGLIAMTAQRDELASVMAHELSHVTQRHIARGVAGEGKNTAITILGTLLGILAAPRAGAHRLGRRHRHHLTRRRRRRIQQQLRFSRDMEREADRVGHGGADFEAGYQPLGMVRMFERMDKAYAADGQRRLPLPALAPADQRAHRRGAPACVSCWTTAHWRRTPQGLAEHTLDGGARSRAHGRARADALQSDGRAWRPARAKAGPTLPQIAARATARRLAAYKLRQRDRGDAAVKAARCVWWPAVTAVDRAYVAAPVCPAAGRRRPAQRATGLAVWVDLVAADAASLNDRPVLLMRAQLAAVRRPTAPASALGKTCWKLLANAPGAGPPQGQPALGRRSARLWELQGQALAGFAGAGRSACGAWVITRGAIERHARCAAPFAKRSGRRGPDRGLGDRCALARPQLTERRAHWLADAVPARRHAARGVELE